MMFDPEILHEVSRDIYFWIRPDPINNPRVNEIPLDQLSYRVYKCAVSPAPTLFLGHGCNGTDWARESSYVQSANAWGFNIVIPDSWGPRGIRECCKGRKPWYRPGQRKKEFYDIARIVKKQDWHQGKIGYIGWSHGGSLALCIAGDWQRLFSAVVAYYPNGKPYMVPKREMLIPTMMHQGEGDRWTPINFCDDIHGKDLIRLTYPNAGHCFDVNKSPRERFEEWLEYDQAADETAREHTRKFLLQHLV